MKVVEMNAEDGGVGGVVYPPYMSFWVNVSCQMHSAHHGDPEGCIHGNCRVHHGLISNKGHGNNYSLWWRCVQAGWSFIDLFLQFWLISAFSGVVKLVLNLTELRHIHHMTKKIIPGAIQLTQ